MLETYILAAICMAIVALVAVKIVEIRTNTTGSEDSSQKKAIEALQLEIADVKAKNKKLDLEVADLTEFVGRSLRKMNSRAYRADQKEEEMEAVLQMARELDQEEQNGPIRANPPGGGLGAGLMKKPPSR